MTVVNHKAKQYLLIALKVFILAVTFGYIYLKITQNEAVDFKEFSKLIIDENVILSIFIFLILAASNWFFEVLKWKTLVSEIQQISFIIALKQSLASLTVSLTTPNRIGEYGAKAYFFEKEKRKSVLLLNFYHNTIQMLVTVFFGSIGLVMIFKEYDIPIDASKLIIVILTLGVLLILGIVFKKQQLIFKGLTFSSVFLRFKNMSTSVKVKVFFYSTIRYIIFCFLFYNLLQFFGVSISISQAAPLIFSMYLLVSVVPTIFIFDVVVRGGVSVWLFSLAGISELPVLSTVFSMWILNFVIPSVIGGYYLLTYKPEVK